MSAEKTNAAKKLEIFIKGVKTDKIDLIDTISIAYELTVAVFKAEKDASEHSKEVKDLAEKFLRKLDGIVPKANLLEGTGLKRPKGHVCNP